MGRLSTQRLSLDLGQEGSGVLLVFLGGIRMPPGKLVLNHEFVGRMKMQIHCCLLNTKLILSMSLSREDN